ncbi:hypothetical protein ACVIRO_001276 [Rhizobium ruizarguesonis]
MLKALLSFIVTVVAKVVEGLVAQMQRDQALKREAVLDAADKTQTVIKETADARSQLRDSDSIDDLVSRMRHGSGD